MPGADKANPMQCREVSQTDVNLATVVPVIAADTHIAGCGLLLACQ